MATKPFKAISTSDVLCVCYDAYLEGSEIGNGPADLRFFQPAIFPAVLARFHRET